jgi:hypothetical protein
VEKSSQKSHHSVRLYEHKKLHLHTLKTQLDQGSEKAKVEGPGLQTGNSSIGVKKLVSHNKNTAIN